MSKKGNGEGTIYYSESKKLWVGQVTNGRQTNGKLNRKTFYGKTRKEVRDKINKYIADIKNDTVIEKSSITITEIIRNNIENKYNSNIISSSTYLRTLYELKIIEKMPIANRKIQDISIEDINKSLQTIVNYSNSVIDKIYSLMSSAYDVAVINKIVLNNPFNIKFAIIKPKSIKNDKKVEALTINEQKQFEIELDKYYEPYRTILFIALYSGMRIGEILALNISDIDFENNQIHITKTLTKDSEDNVILGNKTKTYSGMRNVPILINLKPIIENYIINLQKYNNDYLFMYDNHFIYPTVINAHFKRICKDANIRVETIKDSHLKKDGTRKNLKTSNVNTHMLRHTFATRCIEAGISPVVLSRILGHKDIETTLNTYTDVFNRFKQDEINKIDNYFNGLQ